MDAINNFAQQIEGLPGYDMAVDWINDKAGEKYETKDPFYVEIHGKKKRRKAPETCSKAEQKAWKRVKKRAWFDDKNFFGCYPIDFGLGMAPLLALLPVIGPLMMYAIHARLISIADQEFHLSPKAVTKMNGNILFDLLISIPPIIGSLFSWLNGCSTRNAAIVHTELVKRERAREAERLQKMNIQTNRPENLSGAHAFQSNSRNSNQNTRPSAPYTRHDQTSEIVQSSVPPATQTQPYQHTQTTQIPPSLAHEKIPIRKPPSARYNLNDVSQSQQIVSSPDQGDNFRGRHY